VVRDHERDHDGRFSRWVRSWRADPRGAALADRHYTRQKVGAKQFVPPGSCFVLVTECGRAVWVTSWPKRQYVKHAWAGAWINSIFRNEGAGLSSELIREAVRLTLDYYGEAPWRGLVSFVDAEKTKTRRGRASPPGKCFLETGFVAVGTTKEEGHIALQLLPRRMPGVPPYTPSEFAGPHRFAGLA
jgi:hypothetical protein